MSLILLFLYKVGYTVILNINNFLESNSKVIFIYLDLAICLSAIITFKYLQKYQDLKIYFLSILHVLFHFVLEILKIDNQTNIE